MTFTISFLTENESSEPQKGSWNTGTIYRDLRLCQFINSMLLFVPIWAGCNLKSTVQTCWRWEDILIECEDTLYTLIGCVCSYHNRRICGTTCTLKQIGIRCSRVYRTSIKGLLIVPGRHDTPYHYDASQAELSISIDDINSR